MDLRRLTRADLPAVATVHRAAFPRAAVTRLGHAAARRYYESLLSGPHETVGLGVFEQGRLAGFSFVGVRHIAEIAFVRQHAWFLAGRIATHPWLLVDAFIWERIAIGLRMLRPRSRLEKQPEPAAPTRENSGRSYGIQYLAVAPGCQGRGVGGQLVVASEELARQHGCEEIHLSVYLDNPRAIGLYERMGWMKFPRDGVWRGFMFKQLAGRDPAEKPAAAGETQLEVHAVAGAGPQAMSGTERVKIACSSTRSAP